MSVFKITNLVDKATTDDDNPPKGIVLSESLQLIRQDPSNPAKFVNAALKRLEVPTINVKVKTIKFLLHIVQNGTPAVTTELKLHTEEISRIMGWRGAPHPIRGYEPYQELKESAQSLLDILFSATCPTQASRTVPPNSTNSFQPKLPTTSTMESYGSSSIENTGLSQTRASLEPNDLSKKPRKWSFGKSEVPASIYGQVSNTNPTSLQASPFSQSFDNGFQSDPQVDQPPTTQQPLISTPPPRAQIPRLDADVNWKSKKTEAQEPTPAKKRDTPTTRFLTGSDGRAIPKNSELQAFKAAMKGENIYELEEALGDSEWKVKVRALYGIEAAGEKYGFGAVAHLREKIAPLEGAPQNSLKARASIVLQKMEGVEPEGIPEEPSVFDFVS